MSKVTLIFETKQQANAVLMMAEDGELTESINNFLESLNLEQFEVEQPMCKMDEDTLYPNHEITF